MYLPRYTCVAKINLYRTAVLLSVLGCTPPRTHNSLQAPWHTHYQLLTNFIPHASKPSALQLNLKLFKCTYFLLVHLLLQDCPSIFNGRKVGGLSRVWLEQVNSLVLEVSGSDGCSVGWSSILLKQWMSLLTIHDVVESWEQAIFKQCNVLCCCH